jgi:hypothetical protein
VPRKERGSLNDKEIERVPEGRVDQGGEVSDWIKRVLGTQIPVVPPTGQGTEIVDPYKHETRYKQTVKVEKVGDVTVYSTPLTKDEKSQVDIVTACYNDECKEKDERDYVAWINWVRRHI